MDPVTAASAAWRARRLAGDLQRRGLLTDLRWAEALRAVPRHLFVPQAGWAASDTPGSAGRRIDAAVDPMSWQDAVYSDSSIVIQADDGVGDPASGQGLATSSVSAPGVVVEFLELLDVRPGDRILEIGTGSGWTTALLCHIAGDHQVTSIEVDPVLAAKAAAAIKAAGYAPRLITGDGAAGDPGGAPYDRIHVTCGIADIPRAWIAQARPGGLIVLPWSPGGSTGHKLRGAGAGGAPGCGPFHGPPTYMRRRARRRAAVGTPPPHSQAGTATTRLDPRSIAGAGDGACLAITAQVPGVGWHTIREQDGATSLLLYEAGNPGGAWAACDYEPGAADFPVTQFGPRRLWDEVVAAYRSWLRSGSPGRQRYGITVDAESTRIWLDNPRNIIGEPLPLSPQPAQRGA